MMPIKIGRNNAVAIAQVIKADWYQPLHVKPQRAKKLKMSLIKRGHDVVAAQYIQRDPQHSIGGKWVSHRDVGEKAAM